MKWAAELRLMNWIIIDSEPSCQLRPRGNARIKGKSNAYGPQIQVLAIYCFLLMKINGELKMTTD